MRRTFMPAAVVCVAVCLLASSAPAGRARQAAARARLRHTIAESAPALWSPDNRTLAVLVAGKGLALYDAAAGEARAEIKHQGPPAWTEGVSFTPDGRALIIHDFRVSLYDSADGRLLRELARETSPINRYHRIFRPWEKTDYDSATGTSTTEWVEPSDEEELMELPTRYLGDRFVSPDGKSILVRAEEGRAQVFDPTTGGLKFTLGPAPDPVQKKGRKGVGDALGEFSPDGRLILTTHRTRTPRLWNAATGAPVADLGPQTGIVIGARFSPDGRLVATSTFDDGVVKIWEAATGRLRHTIGSGKDRHYFAAWNPRNHTFVTKTRGWEVKIWNAETGALLARLDGRAAGEKFDRNLTFLYSPDGRLLLTQARNAPSFWQNLGVKKGKPRLIAHLWDAETGALVGSLRDTEPRGAHLYRYDKFFWGPSGDFILTAGVYVKLWNRRGELMQELGGEALLHAGLTADGKLLALTNSGLGGLDSTVASTIVDVAKILVGKLPKYSPPRTQVWQIEAN